MISTCAELIASVKDYSLRTDAPVEMLIQLAESEIAPMIKHYKALKTVDIPINANLTAPLPNDLHELRCPSSNDLRLFGLWKNGVSGSGSWLI